MTDYNLAMKVEKVAEAIAAFAKSHGQMAAAMAETNKIEVERQKREWRANGGTSESWKV